MTRVEINGVALNVMAALGPADAVPLVLLHGFTGSAASWATHQMAWQTVAPTLAVDALGHGASAAPADPARYGLEQVAADLVALADQQGWAQFDLLGYSMGGRMALQLAVAAPARVRRLILESATPGLATEAERAARIASDELLAARLERDGIAPFVDYWERIPLFASQSRLPAAVLAAQRAQRLRNDPRGLAASLRGAGTGRMTPLHAELPRLTVPTLLVAGALDAKFAALAAAMHAALPNAELAVLPDVGHAAHLEAPAAFNSLVTHFIRRP